MRNLFFVLLVAGPLAAADMPSQVSKPYGSAQRPRALVVVGDRYHSPVLMRDGLAAALLRENLPATFIEEVTALNRASLAQHQLLIMARNGRYWPQGYTKPQAHWMTDEQQKAIWDFVQNGGGVLAMHNAHTAYPPGGLYYQLFGGDFGGHPKPYTFTIRITNPHHPITAGVEDYEIFDEQHTSKYSLDEEHLLMRNIARDNLEAPAGWWREMGKGRFCYLSPGHTPEALNHPMTQRLIRNATRWLLRME